MKKYKYVVALLILCTFALFSHTSIAVNMEKVKSDMKVIGKSFVQNAKQYRESLVYVQYVDEIEKGNTTWYLIMILTGPSPSALYIQEEVTVNDGKIVYFDGVTLSSEGWLNDCYGYIVRSGNSMTYLKKGENCINSWDRGIEKFKNKYR